MTNRVSSFPAKSNVALLNRHAGRLTAYDELCIKPLGNDYVVDGSGTVTRLPTLPKGTLVWLRMAGTPTFANSARLICPSNQNYTAVVGDLVLARSSGSSIWRIYVLSSSAPLLAPNNLSDVPNKAAARTNLGVYDYDTKAAAVAATIPAAQNIIRTGGYAAAGDGGAASFKRVGSLPAGAYGFQSVDGAWWQFADIVFNVAVFGAFPDYHEAATLSTGGGATVTATGNPFAAADVGSLICMTGAGVAGATYFGTITAFTNVNSVTVSPSTSTAQTNVFGQWGKDNTTPIQAAINAARVSGGTAGGGTILIPQPSTYCIQQLDFTNAPPIVLKGASTVNGTRLMPMRNTNSVMDWTGTSSPNIDGISVGQYNQLAVPWFGLVISPSNPINGIDFVNLRSGFQLVFRNNLCRNDELFGLVSSWMRISFNQSGRRRGGIRGPLPRRRR
jgi:hypothetical protein